MFWYVFLWFIWFFYSLFFYFIFIVLFCIIGIFLVVEEMNIVRFFEEMLNTFFIRLWLMGSFFVEENCLMADIITIYINSIINRRVKINRSRVFLFGFFDTRVILLCRVGRISFFLLMKMVTFVGLNLLKDIFFVRELSDLLLEEFFEINFVFFFL